MAKRKRNRSAEDAEEQQEVVRQNYLLKNGTTVSVDDYDEDKHDIVDETDEEYTRRIHSAPNARMPGPMHPRTTIANLHTYDSTQVQTPAAALPPPQVIGTAGVAEISRPVATTDEPNTNLLDPTKRTAAGAMVAPEVQKPEDANEDGDEDTTEDE
jgi:hypothetical protein